MGIESSRSDLSGVDDSQLAIDETNRIAVDAIGDHFKMQMGAGAMKDYYKTLEIHPNASLEVMNNAYRTLVRKYHPDLYHVSHKELMTDRMQDINEAYNVLSNAVTRAEYDRKYRQWQQSEPRIKTGPSKRPDTPAGVIRRMILWGVGTYIALRFLKPLLVSPLGKLIVLGLLTYLFFRLYRQSRKKP